MSYASESPETWNIGERIVVSAGNYADNPALTVNGGCWTYKELLAAACCISLRLRLRPSEVEPTVTAVIADRSFSSYVGILSALLGGSTFVPINIHRPLNRTLDVLKRSGATEVICDAKSMAKLEEIISTEASLRNRLRIVKVDCDNDEYPSMSRDYLPPKKISVDQCAYILFTSGSTGEPKGVPISHGNLTGYLDAVETVMDVKPDDRLSQTFELTFDLSVHDLLVAWTNGAHLVVPSASDLASPADYIRKNRITCWFSVPTLAYQMKLQGQLEKCAFPSLRWSMFCGEALPMDLAHRWAAAAPNSRIESWYGPTEATIACARYELSPGSNAEAPNNLAPIGSAFPGMTLTVVNNELERCRPGECGELLLSGRQVAKGYLDNQPRTAQSFVTMPGFDDVFYRTGDLAVCDELGEVRFLGRADNQVKVRGFRVELGAIEAVVRSAFPLVNVAALSWPPGAISAACVVVALESNDVNTSGILSATRDALPDYMVPSRIVCLPKFPTNVSGKSDRKAIASLVQSAFERELENSGFDGVDPVEKLLLKTVVQISPELDICRILRSKSLLEAGMDSLSFVALTVELERVFAVKIDQDLVVTLAECSLSSISSILIRAGGRLPDHLSNNSSNGQHQSPLVSSQVQITARINRVLQFIRRFPEYLNTTSAPIVPVIGSSGVFRGFRPPTFDSIVAKNGFSWQSVNIGLPAIDCESIANVCDFVCRQCEVVEHRIPMAIYELDPMLLSVIPPAGSIRLTAQHFTGDVLPSDELGGDFSWISARAGAPNIAKRMVQDSTTGNGKLMPAWKLKRESEVRQVFLGLVETNQVAVDFWLTGLRHLQAVTDRVIVFVHPIDRRYLSSTGSKGPANNWLSLYESLVSSLDAHFVDWEAFEMQASDFSDVNHVYPGAGSEKLTSQLASMIFGAWNPDVLPKGS